MVSESNRRVRCAANAIAWELYGDDGRATFKIDNGDVGTGTLAAYMTKEETDTVMRIARRVIKQHLDEMERSTDKEAPPA